MFFKVNQKSSANNPEKRRNSNRLSNMLSLVSQLANSQNVREQQVIFYIVKMYSDKINIQHNTATIESISNEIYSEEYITLQDFLPSSGKRILELDAFGIDSFQIELGKFPVISKAWNANRLIDSLQKIGRFEGQNEWSEDKTNHLYAVILPIGVTFILNGFHSANSGIIKSEGVLNITKDSKNIEILDISELYDKFWFDGDYYRFKKDDTIIYKPTFECGCLFEIGRILSENNISFFKVFSDVKK